MDKIIAAVPVSMEPRQAPYFSDPKYVCSQCQTIVWMGPKTKEAADSGTPLYCAPCAIILVQGTGQNVVPVTKLNPNL